MTVFAIAILAIVCFARGIDFLVRKNIEQRRKYLEGLLNQHLSNDPASIDEILMQVNDYAMKWHEGFIDNGDRFTQEEVLSILSERKRLGNVAQVWVPTRAVVGWKITPA